MNQPADQNAAESHGRIAGIDYGTVRIGVAISDPERRMASPLCTYRRSDKAANARYFRGLVEEHRVVRFVVGLPVHLDGHESAKSVEARRFGAWLAETTSVPVDYFDERFTSVEAEHLLQGAQLTSKQRRDRRDMVAAQLLLTAYLEATAQSRSEPPAALDD